MGWFSKVLGIDARRARESQAQAAADAAAKDAAAARARAEAQAEASMKQNQQYNQSMLEIQKQSLATSQSQAAAEEKRINDARDAAIAKDAADADRQKGADTLAANNRVDLRADTVANVVAGGDAGIVGSAIDAIKKNNGGKNVVATSVAKLLGINI